MVEARRLRLGLSKSKLAAELGTTDDAVRDWMSGRTIARKETIAKIEGFSSGGRKAYSLAVPAEQNAGHVGSFEPATLSVSTRVSTAVVAIIFLGTLVTSFSDGGLFTRLICVALGAMLLVCWLFSVKGYVVDGKSILVRHPFWSARFELRGVASEVRLPGNDSIRLFASNWVFGHTLGLCYNKKSGRFFSYVTNPEYRLAVDTERGVLVISPLDKAAVAAALSNGIKVGS